MLIRPMQMPSRLAVPLVSRWPRHNGGLAGKYYRPERFADNLVFQVTWLGACDS